MRVVGDGRDFFFSDPAQPIRESYYGCRIVPERSDLKQPVNRKGPV
jgi:hypothetical protein